MLPAFPIEALSPNGSGALATWAKEVSRALETPAEVASMLALGTVSAIVLKRFDVEVCLRWSEPLGLWPVVVLGPGERKSSVFNAATAPITAWETAQEKNIETKRDAEVARKRIKEQEVNKAIEDGAKSGDARDGQRAQELQVELGEIRLPVAPRLMASGDVTSEQLGILMQEQGGRLAIMEPEGTFFAVVAGRYGNGPNFELALKGHAGDRVLIDRRGRPRISIQRAALSVALCVQPDVLQALSDPKSRFRGKGLLGRCLFVIPQSPLGAREHGRDPADERAVQAYERLCNALLDGYELEAGKEIETVSLRFTPSAYRLILEWQRELEPRLVGDLQGITDWAAKLPGATARIAAVLALADNAESRRADRKTAPEVDADHVRRAIQIARFLTPHALAAFGAMHATNPHVVTAKRLIAWAQRKRKAQFTRREAYQDLKGSGGSVQTVDDVAPPLELLVKHNYLRESGSGTRLVYYVSPKLELRPEA